MISTRRPHSIEDQPCKTCYRGFDCGQCFQAGFPQRLRKTRARAPGKQPLRIAASKQLDRGRPRATAHTRRAKSLLQRWLSQSNCGGGARPESSRKWRLRAAARPQCQCRNCKSKHAAAWQHRTAILIPARHVVHGANLVNSHASLHHIARGRRPVRNHIKATTWVGSSTDGLAD